MILVTGGAGFIGSNFVKYVSDTMGEYCAVVDKLTYASSLDNLSDVKRDVFFHKDDICDVTQIIHLLNAYHPRGIINFAAESHVDNSIKDSLPFIKSNIVGTYSLLEATRIYLKEHRLSTMEPFRFHHISTDEVYGSLDASDTPATEDSPYKPRSPYAASKASADHLVASYGVTHNLPYVITNCSNNYGPKQHSEKLIPTIIRNAYNNTSIPMYGDGSNIRDWIYVEDHCKAIWKVFLDGKNGNRYNIGGQNQTTNKGLIHYILNVMGKSDDLVLSVKDRPGHDFRYDIDTKKISEELGFHPTTELESGLKKTIEWYINEYNKNSGNNSGGGQEQPPVSGDNGSIETVTSNI